MSDTIRTEPSFQGKRALLVADFRKEWIPLMSALQRDGIELEMVGTETLNAAAAACAERDDTVAIVDFWGTPPVAWRRSRPSGGRRSACR